MIRPIQFDNVRSASLADIGPFQSDVRFTPESRRKSTTDECPLRPIAETLAPNRSAKFLPEHWTLGQLDMRLSALKNRLPGRVTS